MARPRTPTKVLDMRGSFKAHPERKAEREGEPEIEEPIGDPPKSLKVAEKKLWIEIIEVLPEGVLTAADRWNLEIACRMMYKLRKADANAGEIGILQKCLSNMGLTPADRSKVKMPAKKEKGKWDE